MHVSIDYQSCSQSKILYSAWPQLFNDVSNMTLWYFLLLTLDFAWKFNLSNFLQVSNFGIYMTQSFQWSTTLAYTCFYIVLNFIFWRGLFAPPFITLYIYIYIYIYLMASFLNLYLVQNFLNFAMSTFYFFLLYLTISILYVFIYSSGRYPGWQR